MVIAILLMQYNNEIINLKPNQMYFFFLRRQNSGDKWSGHGRVESQTGTVL